MRRIRYLSLLWVLLFNTIVWAQDNFNPTNPAEPGAVSKLTVEADPADGGTVTESGLFVVGSSVTVIANAKTGFRFVSWTDKGGNQKSINTSYTFTKGSGSETLIAHFVYDPDAPAEPDEMPFKLTLVAEEGGSVSNSGGRYRSGENVYISANPQSTLYVFVGWYYEDGSLLSSEANYTYKMDGRTTTLTARFRFVPESPAEPEELKQKYKLTLTAEEGGTVYATSTRLATDESADIRAEAKTGYQFAGWYKGETLYSEEANTTFKMGNANVELTAHFVYSPDSPAEPTPAPERKYAFTLYNVSCKPGTTIEFPVYLTTQEVVKDMSFQLTFDARLEPDIENVAVSDKASGYTVNRESGIEIDGMNTYVYTFTGGQLEAGNTTLLNFSIPISESMETGAFYPITVNQITMTTIDDEIQSGGARNGRVSVYKLGDTNGDDAVDSSDVLNMVKVSLNRPTEVFINEVSDINEDTSIDASDVLGVVKIALNRQ